MVSAFGRSFSAEPNHIVGLAWAYADLMACSNLGVPLTEIWSPWIVQHANTSDCIPNTTFEPSSRLPATGPREGANKRGNSSRLTQSFHFFMFEPIFSPVNALNQPI
ncbi:hypothetical protein MC65_006175 [Aeromonas caviae]|nr:hypothetical protein MC65_006175 [Aeromonas caviae]